VRGALQKIDNLGIIENVERFGLRYINYFPEDILENIDLKVYINDKKPESKNLILRLEMQRDKFTQILQIAQPTTVSGRPNELGSIIDIDIVMENSTMDFFKDADILLEDAHNKEKLLFFSLLKPTFLEKLNPIY
jgi:uncharacterized protein (TIGR04255 family)